MVEVLRSYVSDGIGLIQYAAVLIVGAVVLAAWTKTRSIMGTVGAMVVGALVLGYIFNAQWLGQRVGEDIISRENGMPGEEFSSPDVDVVAGSVLPVSGAQVEALGLLWLRTAVTLLWVGAAVVVLVLLRKLTGWRFDVGSPARAARRGMVRARWQSVARSSGLAVTKDRRSLVAGPSLTALLTQPMDRAPTGGPQARKAPIERLPRLSGGRSSPDKAMVTYRLVPARGQTVEDVAEKAQALADGLGVRRVVVRRVGPAKGELVAYLRDVFRLPRAWAPTMMPAAIPWGTDEHGATTSFPLGQGHALFAGATGSGKSGMVNSLVGSCAVRADVALLGVDLKRVELGPWRDRFTEVAVDPGAAAALIAAVADEVRRRYVLLEAQGLRKMTSPADLGVPWIVVVIDELSELLDTIDKGDVISIGRLARACGISLLVATQRPTAKTLTADLRDQLDVMRWCGRVPANSTTGEMVLGEAVQVLDPSTIDRAQRGVGVLDDADGTRLARAWWLDDADVARVAGQTAHLRIPREHVLVATSSTRAAA